MRYVEQINKEDGITVICNLHFLSLARRYAQRVLALRGGELVGDMDPHAIEEVRFREIYGEDAVEVEVR
jgi:phosphonate transport system ATP-binding protein